MLDDFIRGVKDGVKTVGGIFPTLIGLMVSVGILRSSGLLDAFGELLKAPASFLGLPHAVIPTALVRLDKIPKPTIKKIIRGTKASERKSRKDIKTAPQDFYTAYSCEAVIMLYDGCLPMPGIIHLPEKAA